MNAAHSGPAGNQPIANQISRRTECVVEKDTPYCEWTSVHDGHRPTYNSREHQNGRESPNQKHALTSIIQGHYHVATLRGWWSLKGRISCVKSGHPTHAYK